MLFSSSTNTKSFKSNKEFSESIYTSNDILLIIQHIHALKEILFNPANLT